MIHTFADYQTMFRLTEQDLEKRILEFPAGFSDFNQQMHQRGHNVISADPLYQYPLSQLQEYAKAHLLEQDLAIAAQMLDDYQEGKESGRYVACETPEEIFAYHEFELLLCNNWIFKNNANDVFFQENLIKQLCGVTEELRIFPLTDKSSENAEVLAPVMQALQQAGFALEVKDIGYQFEKHAHVMLRVWADKCDVKA